MARSNYADIYQGRTYDYGNPWTTMGSILLWGMGLFLFVVLWLMFKPVDLVARLRGKDETQVGW